MKQTTVFLAFVGLVRAMSQCSIVCQSNPPVQLVAGSSNVSATFGFPLQQRCRAVLQFEEQDFSPIKFKFKSNRMCTGLQQATFGVPKGAPDGSARIFWNCGGSEFCTFANITGGTRDSGLDPEQAGELECLPLVVTVNETVTSTVSYPTATSRMSTVTKPQRSGSAMPSTPASSRTGEAQVSAATPRPSLSSTILTVATVTTTMAHLLAV